MERAEAEKNIQDLREQIHKHDYSLLRFGPAENSDQDYDKLTVHSWEGGKQFPDLVTWILHHAARGEGLFGER